MTKTEFKKQIMTLLATSVDGISDDEKPALVRRGN